MDGKDALTGALIGLSRATYGDTEPDERTWRLLKKGLLALAGDSREELAELTGRVREEKKRLVPRCSVCAAPCGRNADYDMSLLASAPAEVRELKTALLTAAQELAAKPGSGGEEGGRFLAKAIFAIGEECRAGELSAVRIFQGVGLHVDDAVEDGQIFAQILPQQDAVDS